MDSSLQEHLDLRRRQPAPTIPRVPDSLYATTPRSHSRIRPAVIERKRELFFLQPAQALCMCACFFHWEFRLTFILAATAFTRVGVERKEKKAREGEMTNPLDDHRSNEEEASPSMSRSAEDNLSNSEGPLLLNSAANRKRNDVAAVIRSQMQSSAMLMHQDHWHKSHRWMRMLIIVLAFIAFCDFILSATILVVLRVSRGMEALEVIPEKDLLKFSGNTDLDRVCLQRGVCESFGDEPIELMGNAGGVHIKVANRRDSVTWPSLQILKNGTSISQVDAFQVKDPVSGSSIFSTEFPNFNLPQGVRNVELRLTQTHRITAPKASNLVINSDDKISLHGAEGMCLDSKEILWTAKNNIFLGSKNGDIVIDVKDGINLPKIPISSPAANNSGVQQQYKVCVCMPDGKLFLVSTDKGNPKVNCAKVARSLQNDPCT